MTKGYYAIAGFTLAEVLITLGIIGIVAAMTIPAIINQTNGKELEAELKKAYSVLQNAFNQMSYDEGQTINRINYSNQTFIPIFKKYFKISKDCGTFGCESGNAPEGGGYKISNNYKTYNNMELKTNLLDDGQVIISDGMFIMVENINGLLLITIDINGYKKKPNRWGHDLFTFQVMDNGKLLPMGAKNTNYNEKNYCSATATNNYNGIGCTHKALTEKNYFQNLPK